MRSVQTMLTVLILALAFVPLLPASRTLPARLGLQDYPELSPFEAVRWEDDLPYVRVGRTWYSTTSIGGVATGDLLAFCKKEHGSRWIKRFEEDLVQVLCEMGHAPGRTIDLELIEEDGGKAVTLREVEMTEANRRALWKAASERDGGGVLSSIPLLANAFGSRRVEREHAGEPAEAFAHLARARGRDVGSSLTREQACQDLDQLEWLVEHEYSYRDLVGLDYRAAFDAVRAGCGEVTPLGDFAVGVGQLMGLFGDGHTGVRSLDSYLPPEHGPFLVEESGGRLVALRPDRGDFLDARRPYLTALDGVDVERWIEVAVRLDAAGSPQLRRRSGIRNLRALTWVRAELGLPARPTVEVTLADERGRTKTRELELGSERPIYGRRIPDGHRELKGRIGYLRLSSMDSDPPFLTGIDEAMESFRDTRGLVIDVRENGGGSRAALRRLYPYLAGAEDPPRVVNVAAYRLHRGDDPFAPEGYLDNRQLYPVASAVWSRREREAIGELAKTFRSDWSPPAGEFSTWHFFVLSAGNNPRAYAYEKPVVVLMDGGCYSATDIFLGALAGLERVTLVGTPSGGGSGRTRGHRLLNSGLELRLSSMASFRPDGRRYDGLGIEPDELCEPAPEDFLGRGDRVLERALEILEGR